MRQFEYMIEKIEFKEKKKSRNEQMLEVLNKLGKDGWEVCSLSVEPRIAANEGQVSVLLKKKL